MMNTIVMFTHGMMMKTFVFRRRVSKQHLHIEVHHLLRIGYKKMKNIMKHMEIN